MQTPDRIASTAPKRRGPRPRGASPLLYGAGTVAGIACLVLGGFLLARRESWASVAAVAEGALLVLAFAVPSAPWRQQASAPSTNPSPAPRAGLPVTGPLLPALPKNRPLRQRPTPGDTDLYLDLESVEVYAVYVLGTEMFTQLKGGIGRRWDPVTGDERHIETSDVSLTWRCGGRRTAEKLAEQLNEWEAMHTPLRLLAARGRCACLMKDDDHWVMLPELRLAA